MFRWIGGWLAASLTSYICGSVLMTQRVLSGVSGFGVRVDLAARVQTTLQDIGGLAGSYLPLTAVAMAVALLTATLLGRWLPAWRVPLILLAAVTAPPALIGVMTLTFGMNPLAGTAGTAGLLLQALAGLAAGPVFLRVAGPLRRPG